MRIELKIPGREQLEFSAATWRDASSAEAVLPDFRLTAIGNLEFLTQVATLRSQLKQRAIVEIPLPTGANPGSLLIKELLLRLTGKWQFPYEAQELCHCRAVPTERVDQAILTGCHTPAAVSRATSASTACGTCRPDVVAIINYRLG